MPLRRQLGVTAFGVAAYTADSGKELVEPHDESSPGSGKHEELYVVVAGHAIFEVDGERVNAPSGTMILVEQGVHREAMSAADGTTVLIVGGKPGAAMPPSPFDFWYEAQPYYDSGDHERAIEIISAALEHYPDHRSIHYQLACNYALAGHREQALEHLLAAVEADSETREWAAEDSDLDSIRDDPRFPA